jgi:membrane protein YqaA with SNARE-associated domain
MLPDALVAYATLFAWSFLAATIVPLGSEPALFVAVARGHSVIATVSVATLGNYLGACTTYLLARKVASMASFDRLETTHAGRLAKRFGAPALVMSWVPILGDAIVASAGVLRMPFAPFSFWTILGKAARYAVIAWSASALMD